MSMWMMILMALMQFFVALSLFYDHKVGLGIAFLAYAVSTIGLLMAAQ